MIRGGCGGDKFYGGPGDDNIYAKDRRPRARGAYDVIKRGPSLGTVEHDDWDRVAGDCERHVEGFPYGSSWSLLRPSPARDSVTDNQLSGECPGAGGQLYPEGLAPARVAYLPNPLPKDIRLGQRPQLVVQYPASFGGSSGPQR